MPGGAMGSQRAPGGSPGMPGPCPGGPPNPPPMRPGPKIGSPGPTCMPPPPRSGPGSISPVECPSSRCGLLASQPAAHIAQTGFQCEAGGNGTPFKSCGAPFTAAHHTWEAWSAAVARRPHARWHHIVCSNAHRDPRWPVANAAHSCANRPNRARVQDRAVARQTERAVPQLPGNVGRARALACAATLSRTKRSSCCKECCSCAHSSGLTCRLAQRIFSVRPAAAACCRSLTLAPRAPCSCCGASGRLAATQRPAETLAAQAERACKERTWLQKSPGLKTRPAAAPASLVGGLGLGCTALYFLPASPNLWSTHHSHPKCALPQPTPPHLSFCTSLPASL